MKRMRSLVTGRYKYLCALVYVVLCSLIMEMKVYAFQNSIYVTGTKKLFKDVLVGAQGILLVVVIALIVIWEIMKRVSDQNEGPNYFKMQKGAVIGLIVGETIGILIGTIGGYYGFTVE